MSLTLGLRAVVGQFQKVEQRNKVAFLNLEFSQGLVEKKLDLDLPIGRVSDLTLGHRGIRVGYLFELPGSTLVLPNYMTTQRSTDKDTGWQPYIPLNGLQVLLSEQGNLAFISTHITNFIRMFQ